MAPETASVVEQLRETAPVFLVSDVEEAAAYYRERLGFDHSGFWGEPPALCIPYRDDVRIVLEEAADPDAVRPNGARGGEWDAYVWIEDADALFAEVEEAGAKIRSEPTVKEYYGMKEFKVEDLDGHVIVFGEDVA